MEPNIFRFIWRHSTRQQLQLLLLTGLAFPFLYWSLNIPKTIINEALGGGDVPYVVEFLGLSVTMDQIEYLLTLCFLFLALVLINGGFKYVINVYGGVIGERMLRRLRYQLFEHVLRFPTPHFRKVGQGEVVSMVVAETEPLGGFMGDAIKLPAFQGGQLLVIVAFMFAQDPILGAAAIALYPVQAWFIPKLQKRVNELKKEMVVNRRRLSEHIGEVVDGVQEIHAHDTSEFELAGFSQRMSQMFRIRLEIFKRKFMIKFLNNFMAQITPFFFYSIGGYLVIQESLTVGALVAVLAAYERINSPWKELLTYYQQMEDARIRYDLLSETFQPVGMLPYEQQRGEPPQEDGRIPALVGEYIASNVDLRDEPDSGSTQAVSFQLDLAATQAFVGEGGSGIRRIGQVLGRINVPMSGRLTIGGRDLSFLHEGVTGRRIGYVGPDPKLRSGSLFANLVYPLKHRPTGGESLEGRELREAELSGNSGWDVNAEWIDYAAAHATDRDALVKQAMSVLTTVDLDRDVYQLGLQGRVDPNTHPDLVDRIMTARAELRGRLDDPDLVNLVENFDARRYNTNMSVAENLLFGTPADDGFDFEAMADHPLIRDILDETNLTEELTAIGRQLAALMVDLFADVPPGSDLFEQFSFISSDDLPEFRSLLGRTDPNSLDALEARDQSMLLSLPLKLVPARHRLGLIDETLQSRLLRARSLVADRSGASGLSVEFFAAETYNVSGSVQDNILFGRLVYGRARAASQVGALIREVVEKLGLVEPIMEIGLDYEIGVSGARLSGAQRQKLSIARTLLKRPDLLVLDHATASLDSTSEAKIMSNLLEKRSDVGLIWVLQDANLAQNFDNTLVLEGGRVVQQGRAEELNTPDTAFSELLQPK